MTADPASDRMNVILDLTSWSTAPRYEWDVDEYRRVVTTIATEFPDQSVDDICASEKIARKITRIVKGKASVVLKEYKLREYKEALLRFLRCYKKYVNEDISSEFSYPGDSGYSSTDPIRILIQTLLNRFENFFPIYRRLRQRPADRTT